MISPSRIEPIENQTKRSWSDWVEFLDGAGGQDLDHQAIALLATEELEGKLDNPGWWAQSVAVAYEQHIGRRMPGQQADGTFQASVSRSTKLPMQELMDQWVEFAEKEKDVQAIVADEVRQSGTEKRLSWRTKGAEGVSIVVQSEPKKNGTASIVVQLMGLPSAELNQDAKQRWQAIVERFIAGLS